MLLSVAWMAEKSAVIGALAGSEVWHFIPTNPLSTIGIVANYR